MMDCFLSFVSWPEKMSVSLVIWLLMCDDSPFRVFAGVAQMALIRGGKGGLGGGPCLPTWGLKREVPVVSQMEEFVAELLASHTCHVCPATVTAGYTCLAWTWASLRIPLFSSLRIRFWSCWQGMSLTEFAIIWPFSHSSPGNTGVPPQPRTLHHVILTCWKWLFHWCSRGTTSGELAPFSD